MKRLRQAISRGVNRIKQIRRNNRHRRAALKRLAHEHQATVMFDSVTAMAIPHEAPAVALYIDGEFANWESRSMFPHAWKLPITVFGSAAGVMGDCENGDMTPLQVVEWAERQLQGGVHRPVIYASVSLMKSTILPLLKARKTPRHKLRLHSAHYTFTPHICGPHSCGEIEEDMDGSQYTDHGPNSQNYDESLLTANYFKVLS